MRAARVCTSVKWRRRCESEAPDMQFAAVTLTVPGDQDHTLRQQPAVHALGHTPRPAGPALGQTQDSSQHKSMTRQGGGRGGARDDATDEAQHGRSRQHGHVEHGQRDGADGVGDAQRQQERRGVHERVGGVLRARAVRQYAREQRVGGVEQREEVGQDDVEDLDEEGLLRDAAGDVPAPHTLSLIVLPAIPTLPL